MNEAVRLELDDNDLEEIKLFEHTGGQWSIHYKYLNYWYNNRIAYNPCDFSSYIKFKWSEHVPLEIIRKKDDFKDIEKDNILHQFVDYLIKNEKLSLGIIQHNDDYYLMVN